MMKFQCIVALFCVLNITQAQVNPILHIPEGKTVLFGSDTTGTGIKSFWLPSKGAFRAGGTGEITVDGTHYLGNPEVWDYENIGLFSFSLGFSNIASGFASTAQGGYNSSSAFTSIALGAYATASGNSSAAIGSVTTASGSVSIALGHRTTASGRYSTAIGDRTVASGENSTAMGFRVSTNGRKGSLIIGDSDPLDEGETKVGDPDQMVCRFKNGYYFLTSGGNEGVGDPRTGMFAGNGANAWGAICDQRRKENFQLLNDDEVLRKLASVNYTSWNYKGQDPETFRHYGIMAQEFYELFGQDTFGTIGNDTLVNAIDMMGVVMSALKGAKLRTDVLRIQNEALNSEVRIQQTKIEALEREVMELNQLKDEMAELKKMFEKALTTSSDRD